MAASSSEYWVFLSRLRKFDVSSEMWRSNAGANNVPAIAVLFLLGFGARGET
jgi:hypothetical protein